MVILFSHFVQHTLQVGVPRKKSYYQQPAMFSAQLFIIPDIVNGAAPPFHQTSLFGPIPSIGFSIRLKTGPE